LLVAAVALAAAWYVVRHGLPWTPEPVDADEAVDFDAPSNVLSDPYLESVVIRGRW
jgi:hypothetical protein